MGEDAAHGLPFGDDGPLGNRWMDAAWCGVEWGSALSTSPHVTAPAARDHVPVPRASAAPGSRSDGAITLPPLSTKSGKSRAGEMPHPGIILNHCVVDPVKIQSVTLREHVELVGNREIEIAPAVCEQLGELRLLRFELDCLCSQTPEERVGVPLAPQPRTA